MATEYIENNVRFLNGLSSTNSVRPEFSPDNPSGPIDIQSWRNRTRYLSDGSSALSPISEDQATPRIREVRSENPKVKKPLNLVSFRDRSSDDPSRSQTREIRQETPLITNMRAFTPTVVEALPQFPNRNSVFLDTTEEGIAEMKDKPLSRDMMFAPVLVFQAVPEGVDGVIGQLYRISARINALAKDDEPKGPYIHVENANVIKRVVSYSTGTYQNEIFHLEPNSDMQGAFENKQNPYRQGEMSRGVLAIKDIRGKIVRRV